MGAATLMVVRGFCEHGKVWTTCAICGKEVIAAQAGRRSIELDEFGDLKPKKKTVKPPPEEPPEEPAAEEESTE